MKDIDMDKFQRALDPESTGHIEYGKMSRIRFARASISKAKMDLFKLAKLDPTVGHLVSLLEDIQGQFRQHYAKKKLRRAT